MAKVSGKFMSNPVLPKKNALHLLAAALVLIGLGVATERAIHSSLFRLKNVTVENLSDGYPLTTEQVLKLARISLGKQNLFDVNMHPIEERLMKHPWIKGVVIGKEFPDTLSLKIVERKPIALVDVNQGKVLYLEEDGAMFEDQSIVYPGDLPILQGFEVKDETSLNQVRKLIFEWFKPSYFPGLKISSLSQDSKLGLRAVISYPLKNGQAMRPVVELGLNPEETMEIEPVPLRRVLEYLSAKSLTPSKIWLGDGKKIVVKMARGS